MITKETLETINADLARDRIYYLSDAIDDRQIFEETTSKLEDVQDEIEKEEDLEAEEQRDELEEINVDELEHIKIQKKIIASFEFYGLFFGLDLKYGFTRFRRVMFHMTSFFLLFTLFDMIYTTYDKYQNGARLEFLEPLGILGTTSTLSVKWLDCVFLMNNIVCLVAYTPKYFIHQNKTGVTADIITGNLRRTSRIINIYTWGVVAVLSFYLIIPMKFYFFDDELIPILPIYVPFCDFNTLEGFLIGNGLQTVLGAYSGLGALMFGSGILVSICNYGILVDLVQHDIKSLDYMWKHPHKTSIAFRHAFLKNICNKLQDMRSYVKLVKSTYELNLFIYFFMAYSGQVLCIFAISQNNWIPGYTTAGVIFFEMTFYCFVGTQLSSMDEKMSTIIYRDCDWYMFDLKSQKMFQMLLHASQMDNSLQLGPIGTLNMTTGISIVKSIYSYYTVLSEVL